MKLVKKMDLGNRITNLRKKKNMTQEELAKTLHVSDKTISSWEANRTEPNLEILIELSEFFACSIGYLVYGENTKENVETEIRIKLSEKEYKELELFLQENTTFLGETRQIDTYYEPNNRRFVTNQLEKGISIDEWLRIGQRGNKTILNYKHWYDNIYCDEYEIEIDHVENLKKIFAILGLKELIVVDKMRKKFMKDKKYEIVLDTVATLGYFVEIEVKEYEFEVLEEYENLLKFAKKLNLNLENVDRVGYAYHLLDQKIKKSA